MGKQLLFQQNRPIAATHLSIWLIGMGCHRRSSVARSERPRFEVRSSAACGRPGAFQRTSSCKSVRPWTARWPSSRNVTITVFIDSFEGDSEGTLALPLGWSKGDREANNALWAIAMNAPRTPACVDRHAGQAQWKIDHYLMHRSTRSDRIRPIPDSVRYRIFAFSVF